MAESRDLLQDLNSAPYSHLKELARAAGIPLDLGISKEALLRKLSEFHESPRSSSVNCEHQLKRYPAPKYCHGSCSVCGKRWVKDAIIFGCKHCDYNECKSCHEILASSKVMADEAFARSIQEKEIQERKDAAFALSLVVGARSETGADFSELAGRLDTLRTHLEVLTGNLSNIFEESGSADNKESRHGPGEADNKELQNKIKEMENEKLCVVCLTNHKSHIITPCMHFCLCQTCADSGRIHKCPMCRKRVRQISRVY